MPAIELIYDGDCPNAEGTRTVLREALLALKRAPTWREWDRADPQAPSHVRAWGSPTILVDGKDIAGMTPSDATCCRIYRNKRGVPERELVLAAIQNASRNEKPTGGKIQMLALLPTIGSALAPKLVCPACWPAYAGLLSALGLGFVNYSPYLLPLTAVFLTAVLASLAWRAGTRRGYAPFALGLVAAATVLAEKFHFDSNAATYAGIALLIGASLWNAWPRRNPAALCPACVTDANRMKSPCARPVLDNRSGPV